MYILKIKLHWGMNIKWFFLSYVMHQVNVCWENIKFNSKEIHPIELNLVSLRPTENTHQATMSAVKAIQLGVNSEAY